MTQRTNPVKVPPPRPLLNSETTHTLAQWRINFRQYCKRDEAFKHFLKSSTTWDAAQENYGFTVSVDGKDPSTLADELEDFAKQRPKVKQSQAIWPCLVLFSIESSHPATT